MLRRSSGASPSGHHGSGFSSGVTSLARYEPSLKRKRFAGPSVSPRALQGAWRSPATRERAGARSVRARPPRGGGGRQAASGGSHGFSNSSAISSVNDTIGAHDGAVMAIVKASLTPITTPATSGPSALPRPPIITAAKTTPIQA